MQNSPLFTHRHTHSSKDASGEVFALIADVILNTVSLCDDHFFTLYFKDTHLVRIYGWFVYMPGTNLYLKAAKLDHPAEVFPTCPLPAKM